MGKDMVFPSTNLPSPRISRISMMKNKIIKKVPYLCLSRRPEQFVWFTSGQRVRCYQAHSTMVPDVRGSSPGFAGRLLVLREGYSTHSGRTKVLNEFPAIDRERSCQFARVNR
ncbi:hypothetical protein ElyMa_001484800 [Elysia marginata]|uniref:Uncharacterized protein n=1 Tax=Elysia marginata TaxID=1093978 RepID=A0AAV4J4L7_9GAST|nr:hypothetical protein ElyMa_001484800 [Elysia marginata]